MKILENIAVAIVALAIIAFIFVAGVQVGIYKTNKVHQTMENK